MSEISPSSFSRGSNEFIICFHSGIRNPKQSKSFATQKAAKSTALAGLPNTRST